MHALLRATTVCVCLFDGKVFHVSGQQWLIQHSNEKLKILNEYRILLH